MPATDRSSPRTVARPDSRSTTSLIPPSPSFADYLLCGGSRAVCLQAVAGSLPGGDTDRGRPLCWEPDLWDRREKWQDVGHGKGAYELVDKYEKLEAGGGDYKEVIVSRPLWSCKACCLRVARCILTMALLFGFYWALATYCVPQLPKPWMDQRIVAYSNRFISDGESAEKTIMVSMEHAKHDAEAGFKTVEEGAQAGVATVLQKVGLHSAPLYDCKVEGVAWVETWEVRHKQWCCEHEHNGCPPDRGYNCHENQKSWNTTWPSGKKHFCCGWDLGTCISTSPMETSTTTTRTAAKTVKTPTIPETHASTSTPPTTTTPKSTTTTQTTTKPTTTTPPTTTIPEPTTTTKATTSTTKELFDCMDWRDEWTQPKKDYCCERHGMGCPVTTTCVQHDCEFLLERWEVVWTHQKKDWCCQHQHLGCKGQERQSVLLAAAAPSPATAPATLPATTVAPATTQAKLIAALPLPSGCSSLCTIEGSDYSCKERISWLLKTDMKGQDLACELALGQVLSECKECSSCSLVETGCETLPPQSSEGYDCFSGPADSWGIHKKKFCCDKGVGCPAKYACFGDSSFWGSQEMTWCCTNKKLGCVTPRLG